MDDEEKWKQKIVVDDTVMHFHRQLPATEMMGKGFNSSNQV